MIKRNNIGPSTHLSGKAPNDGGGDLETIKTLIAFVRTGGDANVRPKECDALERLVRMVEELQDINADMCGRLAVEKSRLSEAEKALVTAVIPLEALKASGTKLSPELEKGVDDGIAAVRNAMEVYRNGK